MGWLVDFATYMMDVVLRLWTWVTLPGDILTLVFSPPVLKVLATTILTKMIEAIQHFTPAEVDAQLTSFQTFMTGPLMGKIFDLSWWLVDQVAAASVVAAIIIARLVASISFLGIRVGIWAKKMVWN